MLDEVVNRDTLWQMSLGERASLLYLLGRMESKQLAIEVGTYRGGFLQILSREFSHVYSLDLDNSRALDRGRFSNVTWVEGDSKKTLPALIKRLGRDALDLNFVLVDGDHDFLPALHDITSVLEYKPRSDLLMAVHDSWYGPTREAINRAPWSQCQHVHLVEKDFVPGDVAGDLLVGGLCLALLRPQPRDGPLEIGQSQDLMYRLCRSAVARL